MIVKICTRCKKIKYISDFYAYKSITRGSRVHSECKECFNEYMKLKGQEKREKLKALGLRKCEKCKQLVPIDQFQVWRGNTRKTCDNCLTKPIPKPNIRICLDCKKEFIMDKSRRYTTICRDCESHRRHLKRYNRKGFSETLKEWENNEGTK